MTTDNRASSLHVLFTILIPIPKHKKCANQEKEEMNVAKEERARVKRFKRIKFKVEKTTEIAWR